MFEHLRTQSLCFVLSLILFTKYMFIQFTKYIFQFIHIKTFLTPNAIITSHKGQQDHTCKLSTFLCNEKAPPDRNRSQDFRHRRPTLRHSRSLVRCLEFCD